MDVYTISQWVLFFYIYCFLGWVWESTYVSVKSKKLVNRGFLKGPLLPIYGSGAVCVLVATIPVRDNIALTFVVGMVAATALEYVAGAVMERLFRVRYWDYSGKPFNVNGYICLGSTVCWGVMTVLMVNVLHRYVADLVLAAGETWDTAAALVLTPFVTADFMNSFHAAIHLRDILVRNEKLNEELQKLALRRRELEQRLADAGEKAREQRAAELQELLLRIGELRGRLAVPNVRSIHGLLRRNPAAVSRLHRETFAQLKQSLAEKIGEIKNI